MKLRRMPTHGKQDTKFTQSVAIESGRVEHVMVALLVLQAFLLSHTQTQVCANMAVA